MSPNPKISPAFEPFMADSNLDDRRDAIVIYRAPAPAAPRVRGSMRVLQSRLKAVKARARRQGSVEAKIFDAYQRGSRKRSKRKTVMATASIGTRTLVVVLSSVMRTDVRPRFRGKNVGADHRVVTEQSILKSSHGATAQSVTALPGGILQADRPFHPECSRKARCDEGDQPSRASTRSRWSRAFRFAI